jgi:BMFP domain-containing protein YqiC
MMKLQLDLETLEQMIGGNNPFHLEIREGIVQTFARRHLKSLVNTKILRGMRQEIDEEIKKVKKTLLDELLAELPVKKKGSNYYSTGWLLDKGHPAYEKMRAQLKEAAVSYGQQAVLEALSRTQDSLNSYIDTVSRELQTRIKAEVERQFNQAFEKRVQVEVNRRLVAAAGGAS